MESSLQADKISDIVKLKRMLKKWRNQASNGTDTNTINDSTTRKACTSKSSSFNSSSSEVKKKGSIVRSYSDSININSNSDSGNSEVKKKGSLSRSNSIKGISFLKRTLSFTDLSTHGASSNNNGVPKGFLAVHVGEDMKRFVIPTNYLKHKAFCLLLKEAEDEFGFQQEGILRIPCEVEVFENILRRVEAKNNSRPHSKQALNKFISRDEGGGIVCRPTDGDQSLSKAHHPPSPMCR